MKETIDEELIDSLRKIIGKNPKTITGVLAGIFSNVMELIF